MPTLQKITTFLWFNDNAEEAVNHYISIFNNSKILRTTRYNEAGPGPIGSVMTMDFQLEGQQFIALNGGPEFKFNEAISLFVNCESQSEVDHLWATLVEGGKAVQCGWVQDKFGLFWQITPTILLQFLHDPDRVRAKRVMEAMFKMVKLDISELQRAFDGR